MELLVNSTANRTPLPDESVHCVVTSPPYWSHRDYGLLPMVWGGEPGCVHEWGECVVADRRESTSGRDDDGFRRNREAQGRHRRGGQSCLHCNAWLGCLGLEPTPALYVQHLVEVFKEVHRVLRPDGICWLNLGDSYFGDSPPRRRSSEVFSETWDPSLTRSRGGMRRSAASVDGLKPKDMVGIPWMVAFALRADGWWLRSGVIWAKGRDGDVGDDGYGASMPDSSDDRPASTHEFMFLLTKSRHYFYDNHAVRVNWERGSHCLRDVWLINTKGYKGAHFAVYPPALVEPCIKAGTSKRGCCPQCGAPWERVVERIGGNADEGMERPKGLMAADVRQAGYGTLGSTLSISSRDGGWKSRGAKSKTIGWRPSCACSGLAIIKNPPTEPVRRGSESEAEFIYRHTAWKIKVDKWWQHWASLEPLYAAEPTVPAIVLDPFAGSGTTLVVARALGQHGVGLDLSLPYLKEQATPRLALDRLREWGEKAKPGDGDPLAALPLFSER